MTFLSNLKSHIDEHHEKMQICCIRKGWRNTLKECMGPLEILNMNHFSLMHCFKWSFSDWCSISTLLTDMVPNCPYEILSMCLFKLLLTLLIVVVSWAQAILLWTSISKLSTDIVPNDFMHCFNMLIQCTLLTQRGWISTHCRYGSYVLMHCFHIMI